LGRRVPKRYLVGFEPMQTHSKQPIKISVNNVTKTFGHGTGNAVTAIDGFNLEIRDGELISLLGPSGCGKSTFLYLIGGFEKITEGEILLDGVPITGPGSNRGVVFQEYVLFPWQTVARNIEYGLRLNNTPKEQRVARVKELVRMIGLEGFEDVYPFTLSGGMQQRVSIARAMAYDPDVMLMDEPFGALDAQTRNKMLVDLIGIHEKTHKTILFVTHSVEEAVMISDRVCLFSSRPSKVKEIIEIEIEHPRSVTDDRFVTYQKRLIDGLAEKDVGGQSDA
jgi:NitT/TauT family transport system ATP-binding protein